MLITQCSVHRTVLSFMMSQGLAAILQRFEPVLILADCIQVGVQVTLRR